MPFRENNLLKYIPVIPQKSLENAMNLILDKKKTFDSEKLRSYAIDHFSYEAIADQYNSIYQKIKFEH